MMIYKITLTISGDDFLSSAVKLPSNNLRVENSWEACTPIEPISAGKTSRTYGYGGMMFMHNRCWGTTETNKEQYESDFVDFLQKNEQTFLQCGAQEAELLYEVLMEEAEESDTTILSSPLLKRLGGLSILVFLPVSIYHVNKPLFNQYLNEIKEAWA